MRSAGHKDVGHACLCARALWVTGEHETALISSWGRAVGLSRARGPAPTDVWAMTHGTEPWLHREQALEVTIAKGALSPQRTGADTAGEALAEKRPGTRGDATTGPATGDRHRR